MRIRAIADLKTSLGEGPLWDAEQQMLYFIDSADGRIFRSTADGRQIKAWDVREKIGSMALRADGQSAIVALQQGLYSFDFKHDRLELLHSPESDIPSNRFNDGKVDSRGRFVVGSMDTNEKAGTGKLYSLDPELTLTTLDSGIVCSNGPCWSPDEKTFYFTDSWGNDIWAYDYDPDTGAVSNRRSFVGMDKSDGGVADGMTVDAEGYLWEAHVFGGKLNRYAPDGSLDRTVAMPVKKVTSVMFGGPNLDILYVTSMGRPPLPGLPDDGPMRGAVFAIEGLGVKGLPAHRFGS